MSTRPRPGLAVLALSLGTALNPLNSSMFAVALVVLRTDFGLDVAAVTWVITAFYLASAAAQPLMGRLADRFGPQRLFSFGMVLVILSCALAPFSPNFFLLCAARVVMADGTATAFPSAVVMIAELSRLANSRSTGPLGRIQMANTSAAAVGPVVGGVLVSVLGWQALFAINVPLAVIALVLVRRVAPPDGGRETGKLLTLVRDSDVPGVLGFVGGLLLAMMALLDVVPGYRWWLLAGSVVLSALFAWRELRFEPPFLDLRLLGRNRPLLLLYLLFAVFSGVYYFAFYGLPQLLQEAGGFDPGIVGLFMLPLAAASVMVTPPAMRMVDRFGVRRVLVAGALAIALASGALGLLTVSFWPPLVLLLTAFMGIPYGVVGAACHEGLYLSARPEDKGVAAGIFQTCRYVGAIGATVLVGVLYGPGVNQDNWGVMALVMLGLSILVVVLALFWRGREA